MAEFYFAQQNDDGTYGKPIKAEVVDISIKTTTQGVGEPIPNFMLWDGGEIQFSIDDPYKFMKRFAWAMLNLKRSTKHLVSKNIVKGDYEDV